MSSRGDQNGYDGSFCPLRTTERGSSLGSLPAVYPALQAGLPRAGGAAVACRTVLSHSSAQNIEGLFMGRAIKGRKRLSL